MLWPRPAAIVVFVPVAVSQTHQMGSRGVLCVARSRPGQYCPPWVARGRPTARVLSCTFDRPVNRPVGAGGRDSPRRLPGLTDRTSPASPRWISCTNC
jgi:hypothetical protein